MRLIACDGNREAGPRTRDRLKQRIAAIRDDDAARRG